MTPDVPTGPGADRGHTPGRGHDGRAFAPYAADEVATWRGFLDHHRDILRAKSGGLDADWEWTVAADTPVGTLVERHEAAVAASDAILDRLLREALDGETGM